MAKWVNKLFSILYAGVAKPNQPKIPMTEDELLATIPDDWVEQIEPEQLADRTKAMWLPVISAFAEQVGINESHNLALIINQLAAMRGVTEKQQIQTLKDSCLQNAKIELFTELYGELFESNEEGQLSYSPAMLKKITGLSMDAEVALEKIT